jgi:dipeptidase
MERQVEGTSSESERTISDEEFVDEEDDEWDSVSQFSVTSETSASSNSSSSVWLYFDKSPANAPDYNVCQKCSKQYSQATSVTVLRKHLRSHQLNVPTRTEKKDTKEIENPLSKKEQKEHDKYLVQWLIRNLQPFTVVDNPSFRDFINHLCSRYVLPGRHKAKGNLFF